MRMPWILFIRLNKLFLDIINGDTNVAYFQTIQWYTYLANEVKDKRWISVTYNDIYTRIRAGGLYHFKITVQVNKYH